MDVALFILALAAGIAGLYWMILRSAAGKIAAQYQRLSDRFELELNQPAPAMGGFIRPEPSVYGDYEGRELSISVPGKGLQNTRQIETVLKLETKEQKFAAQITSAGMLGGFRQRDGRGLQRWNSGDAGFDKAVDLRTNDPKRAEQLFDAESQQVIQSLLKAGKGSIYIGSGVMAYAELGLLSSETARERFEQVLRLFLEIASKLESE